jgi:hypothetical protein
MKLDETIATLKTMLPADDFILTGSYVLAKYGLVSWDKVADLDIILVKPNPETIDTLNRFMKDFPAPSTARLKALPVPTPEIEEVKEKPVGKFAKFGIATPSKLQAIFLYNKVKIDVFIEDNFSETTLLIDGIKHATIPHILNAKKMYGRMKDWMQCRDMNRMFYIEEEFQQKLCSWPDLLRSDPS